MGSILFDSRPQKLRIVDLTTLVVIIFDVVAAFSLYNLKKTLHFGQISAST